MTRRMLINAQHDEECRIAVADDDLLLELEVERADQTQLKGNIYKAPIARIEPSLQAAFIDIGSSRNGFLQINDINQAYYKDWPPANAKGKLPRPSIKDVLKEKQELVVQVVKDERSLKGATLTTNLSIPGRYLVLMVGNQRGGVSRKIVDEGQRNRLRGAVQDLKIPPGMGVIVRTAGLDKSTKHLQADLDALMDIWRQILTRSMSEKGPACLYQESDLAIRTIRDYLTPDIDEILIDNRKTFERAKSFVDRVMPNFSEKLRFYDEQIPIFSRFHLDSQVDETDRTEVTLPSGGSIVINTTEAVVAVDVNSGRSTSQSDVEETAFATNKEAAVCVAKQLRLRDLGGLVVIDFIDMNDRKHKQIIERTLKDSVSSDKARIEIGRISKFGLLEMSRQRLKSSLVSQSHRTCSHCEGRGRVKTFDSAALDALRKIQSAAFAGGVKHINIYMAPAAALLLLNEKRSTLVEYETLSKCKISVFADGRMKPEEYKIELGTDRPESSSRVLAARTRQAKKADNGGGNRKRSGNSDNGNKRGRSRNNRRGRGRKRTENSGNKPQNSKENSQDKKVAANSKETVKTASVAPEVKKEAVKPKSSEA